MYSNGFAQAIMEVAKQGKTAYSTFAENVIKIILSSSMLTSDEQTACVDFLTIITDGISY